LRLQKNIRFFCELSEKELIFAVEKELNMEIIFNEEYLREMYNTGKSSVSCPLKPSDSAPLC